MATCIFMFLVPSCLEYLSLNNLKGCKKGTRIVCYKFPLPGKIFTFNNYYNCVILIIIICIEDEWKYVQKIETEDVINPKLRAYVYLYIVR